MPWPFLRRRPPGLRALPPLLARSRLVVAVAVAVAAAATTAAAVVVGPHSLP